MTITANDAKISLNEIQDDFNTLKEALIKCYNCFHKTADSLLKIDNPTKELLHSTIPQEMEQDEVEAMCRIIDVVLSDESEEVKRVNIEEVSLDYIDDIIKQKIKINFYPIIT